MNLTRRYLIKVGILSAAVLIGLVAVVRKLFDRVGPEGDQPDEALQLTSLEAVVDTLVPADEMPGAVQMGVAAMVSAWAQSAPKLQEVHEQFCAGLDQQAQRLGAGHFGALDADQREVVLAQFAKGDAGAALQRFFLRLRTEVFTHYYADRRSWTALDYGGPPQPLGFMNYTDAPRQA